VHYLFVGSQMRKELNMSAYGKAALRAVELLRRGACDMPQDAWRAAVSEEFSHSASARAKGCPRSAFLGLCSSGAISGVPAGDYTRSKKNKHYALRALEILQASPQLADDQVALWAEVAGGGNKTPNHQMQVVTSLWFNGDLLRRPVADSAQFEELAL
jgi:hypothetical protein